MNDTENNKTEVPVETNALPAPSVFNRNLNEETIHTDASASTLAEFLIHQDEYVELGVVSDTEHSKVVSTIQRLGFSDVWLVGDNFKRQNPPFPVFDNVDEVKAKLLESPLSDRLILIKGSNSTHLYQLPEFL